MMAWDGWMLPGGLFFFFLTNDLGGCLRENGCECVCVMGPLQVSGAEGVEMLGLRCFMAFSFD